MKNEGYKANNGSNTYLSSRLLRAFACRTRIKSTQLRYVRWGYNVRVKRFQTDGASEGLRRTGQCRRNPPVGFTSCFAIYVLRIRHGILNPSQTQLRLLA